MMIMMYDETIKSEKKSINNYTEKKQLNVKDKLTELSKRTLTGFLQVSSDDDYCITAMTCIKWKNFAFTFFVVLVFSVQCVFIPFKVA